MADIFMPKDVIAMSDRGELVRQLGIRTGISIFGNPIITFGPGSSDVWRIERLKEELQTMFIGLTNVDIRRDWVNLEFGDNRHINFSVCYPLGIDTILQKVMVNANGNVELK